jgi:hypothetical protein
MSPSAWRSRPSTNVSPSLAGSAWGVRRLRAAFSSGLPRSEARAGRIGTAGRLARRTERADEERPGSGLGGGRSLRVARGAAAFVVAAEVALLQRLAVGVVLEAGLVLGAAGLLGQAGGAAEAGARVTGIFADAARGPGLTGDPAAARPCLPAGARPAAGACLRLIAGRARVSRGASRRSGAARGAGGRGLRIFAAARDGDDEREAAARDEAGASSGEGDGSLSMRGGNRSIGHAPTIASAKMGVRCAFDPSSSSPSPRCCRC